MHLIGSPAFSRRALTVAVEHGYRLLARLADGSSGRRRPNDQRRSGGVDPSASVGRAPQVSDPPPAAGPTGNSAPTPTQQQRRQRAPARLAAATPVTPAMVRCWAQEQGIEVADRGPIPRSVMEQYLATAAGAAPLRRQNRAQRPPSSAA